MHAFVLPPAPLTSPSSIATFHPLHTPIPPHPRTPHLRLYAKFHPSADPAPPPSPLTPPSSLPPIVILLAETAVQLSVAAFAIIASVLAHARFLAFASAFFAIPQVLWSVRRYLHHRRTTARLQHPSHSPHPTTNEHPHDALSTTPPIHTLMTEQVQSLRHALDQVERSALVREERRNAAIAQMLSSLDSGLRDLRQLVETRNRLEAAAPIPLVAEVEVLRGRLRDVERDKTEVEGSLRMAQLNFEEAKRGGEQIANELEEAVRREMALQEELEEMTVKGARLDGLVEQLERAERRNDELRQRILGRIREREEWRGKAGEAEKKAKKVQNVMSMLKEKLGIRDEDVLTRKDREAEDLDSQLREQRSFGAGSLLYEELLGDDKRDVESENLEWPDGALEGGNSDKKQQAQLKGLPPDGGFGASSESSGEEDRARLQGVDGNTPQLPGGAVDNVFSFSRGEFESPSQKSQAANLVQRDTNAVDTADGEQRNMSPGNDGWVSRDSTLEPLPTDFIGGRNELSLGNEDAAPVGDDSSIYRDSSSLNSSQHQSPGSEEGSSASKQLSGDENLRREREPQYFDDRSRSIAAPGNITGKTENSTLMGKVEEYGDGDVMSKSNSVNNSSQIIRGSNLNRMNDPSPTTLEDTSIAVDEPMNAPQGPMITKEDSGNEEDIAHSYSDLDGALLSVGMEPEESGGGQTAGSVSSGDGVDADETFLKPFSTSVFLQTREQRSKRVSKDMPRVSTDGDQNLTLNIFQGTSSDSSSAATNLKEQGQPQTPIAEDRTWGPSENRQEPKDLASEPVPSDSRNSNSPLTGEGILQKTGDDSVDLSLPSTPPLGINDLSRDNGSRDDNGTDSGKESIESQPGTRSESSFYSLSINGEARVEGTLSENVKERQELESQAHEISQMPAAAPASSIGEQTSSAETGSIRGLRMETSSDSERELSSSGLRASANELVRKARRRGLAVAQSGRLFQRAVSKLEAALEVGEEKAAVEGQLGATLVSWAKTNIGDVKARGMLERAVGLLSRSLEKKEEAEGTICSLGLCLCLLGSTSDAEQARGYYERACALYDGLLERNEESRVGYFNCGLAYTSLGRLGKSTEESVENCRAWFEKAVVRFERAVELDADDVKAQMYVENCRREIAELERLESEIGEE